MNRKGLAWLAAMVCLLASGCVVDQAREVQMYREVLDVGQTQPPTPFSQNESVTLKRALVLANANNEQLAESGLRRMVLRELRVAVDNVTADAQQINQLGVRLTAAREALRQADAAYRAGLGTNLQRLIAQNQLLSAELALTEEQFNHIVDYMRLLRVVGVLHVALTPLPPAAGSDPAARDARPGPMAGAGSPPQRTTTTGK